LGEIRLLNFGNSERRELNDVYPVFTEQIDLFRDEENVGVKAREDEYNIETERFVWKWLHMARKDIYAYALLVIRK